MVSISPQECVEKFLACGFGTAAGRLHGDKHGVDLRQHGRVVEFQCPAVLILVVQVENTEVAGDLLRRFLVAPGLEGLRDPTSSDIL